MYQYMAAAVKRDDFNDDLYLTKDGTWKDMMDFGDDAQLFNTPDEALEGGKDNPPKDVDERELQAVCDNCFGHVHKSEEGQLVGHHPVC